MRSVVFSTGNVAGTSSIYLGGPCIVQSCHGFFE